MNYQELNYVLCVAKHQSLTKAAQELYVSQPTLTKHLQKLEREMNGKLFSRNGNTYIPTYLGRKYMEYARKVLAVRQDWEKELKDLTDCKEGELNIAFPLMRSSCMVPPVLDAFCQKYPDIHINIFEEAYSIQEKLLLDDRLDFAIFNETKEHPGLNYEFLNAAGASACKNGCKKRRTQISMDGSEFFKRRNIYSSFSGTDDWTDHGNIAAGI